MTEDPAPYGTRRPPAAHPWTLRLEDGAEVTIEAPTLRAALDVLQRRQIMRKIGTRAPVVGAARADLPTPPAVLAILADVRAHYAEDIFTPPDGTRTFPPDCYTAAGARLACDLLREELLKAARPAD
jgi:hypothetical protein